LAAPEVLAAAALVMAAVQTTMVVLGHQARVTLAVMAAI
jgi:hypothetical protein